MDIMTPEIKTKCKQINDSMYSERMKIIFTSMKKIHVSEYLELKL